MTALQQISVGDIIKYLKSGVGCLDTRKLESYRKHHFINSTYIHENQLKDRMYELPPKQCQFLLIPHSNQSCKILNKNGWNNFIMIDLSENEWKSLKEFIIYDDKNDVIDYYPLFHPCPILSQYIDEIEKCLFKNNNNITNFSCCDIGCGSGRDDIWLSLRKTKINKKIIRWNIDCIDFNDKMLHRLSKFAGNVNCSNQISIKKSKIRGDDKITLYKNINDDSPFLIYDINKNVYDIHKIDNVEEKKENVIVDDYYFKKEYDLILSVRFLQRCIVNKMWKFGKMLKKNGYLLIFQFLDDINCEKYGHPKNKNRLLKRGELNKIFGNKEMFKIIVDSEVIVDGDRPIHAFLCTKLN